MTSFNMTRVLMISKACVVGAYQRKLEEMATLAPEMELILVVPPYWRNGRGRIPLERAHLRGYCLEVLPIAFNGHFHLHFYPQLGRLLRRYRPQIVHIDEEPYNLATYHANRLARHLGAKTLWFSWQNLHRIYPPPWSWMERYTLHHSDYAIVGSHAAARVWRAKGYTGPLAIIPQFGVDPALFSPSSDPRPATPVHIAYVGRLVPEKGVDLLLRAVATLKGAWYLTILGDGPQREALRAITRTLKLEGRVRFQAPIPSTDMPAFYRTVDVLVLPSRTRLNWTEQFGRVLIEAMACGVAVVGSDAGEIPHVIGEAGLIFPEADIFALHIALHRLLTTPSLRRTLGQRGRARVQTHFTQRAIAQQTLDVYRKLHPFPS